VCARTGTGTAPSLRTERRARDAQALVIYALVLLGIGRLAHKRSIEPLIESWQHSSWMTAYSACMQGAGHMRRGGSREPTRHADGEALFRSAEHDVEVDELLNACEDRATLMLDLHIHLDGPGEYVITVRQDGPQSIAVTTVPAA
jgi:hypothetical protein